MSNGNGNQKSSYKGGVLKKSLFFEGKDLFIHKMFAELTRRKKAANIKPDFNIDVFMKDEHPISPILISKMLKFLFIIMEAAATEGQKASVVTDYYLKVAAMLKKLEKEIDDVDAKIGEGWLLLDSPTISIVKLMR